MTDAPGARDFHVRPYIPQWDRIRRRIRDHDWAAQIFEVLVDDFRYWQDRLHIPPPDEPTTWSHQYYCTDDGTALVFDPELPQSHHCESCDAVYSGEPWDGAWRTKMHAAAAGQAQRAALLVRLAPDDATRASAVEQLGRILQQYAETYALYEPHGANAGIGRVQPQALDEAVWVITLLRAARWAGGALSPETDIAVDRLAAMVAELLTPQLTRLNNVQCWIVAALAECGARLKDKALLEICRDGEYGAENQIRAGFHREGFWNEANVNYHYYALDALLSYREALGPDALSAPSVRMLARAVRAPLALAFTDGTFPSHGDGSPNSRLSDFAPSAEAARTLLPEFTVDVGPFYRADQPTPLRLWSGTSLIPSVHPETPGRFCVAALVFGPDEHTPRDQPERCFVWREAGIAVLSSPLARLNLRFGPDAGWHDHRDKLAVDMRTTSGWSSLDLGTSGYGAEMTAWLRSPLAHNLVVIDAARQPPHTGKLVDWSPTHVTAWSGWNGVQVTRSLTLTQDGWVDQIDVDLDQASDLEWVMHGDGRIEHPQAIAITTPFTRSPGHKRLQSAAQVPTSSDGCYTVRWSVAGSPTLRVSAPAGFELFLAEADGNPTGHELGIAVVRGRAAHASFRAEFTVAGTQG